MRTLLLIIIALSLIQCEQAEEAERPPNIILIMADDLGYETLGCNGSLEYSTPNLDRLAANGMRFTNFHSTPLCTPTRVQIMTGKYNNRNYMAFGMLDSGEKTFAHYLKEAGYKTAVTGKWQLFGNKRQQELAGNRQGSLPMQAGFDEWCLWQVQDRGYRFRDARLEINGDLVDNPSKYGPDLFLEFAEDFIETNRDSSFFLYFPMALVHDPFEPTPDSDLYHSFERPMNDTTHFASMVSYMDSIVGRIQQKVIGEGLEDNTILIFLGDNGTDRDVVSRHITGQIPGKKGRTVKHGTHVPFIAHGRGVKTGTYSGLADLTDILPTLLEYAGLMVPDELDGHSMKDVFAGENNSIRDWIYCYYHPNWGTFKHTEYVFDEEYKLYSDGRLFRYHEDLAEENPIDPLDPSLKGVRQTLQKVLDQMK